MATSYSLQPIVITATTALTQRPYANNICVLDSATGRTVTLPASTGKGDVYTVFVKTSVSSGSHVVQVANSTDVLSGALGLVVGVAGTMGLTASTSDTITMNGSTTGGLFGSIMQFTDVAAGFWMLTGSLNGSGTMTTPFSAAV
ncbi:hypothetical protein EN866_32965 [Mesorhizobium sp. M2D.F.Ca.ET.223.01.1.1]|uniref:hypothetical protein n=1 Tax=Mesorhizobium sp. M2D.F.Ca.ET.223.01.1.1 TaxID=2563940 RepID=UPI0010933718|nr:hypothetical protein [Mesorhizobium sp. M2D.F.Ca.ET.223.01.1.1]TGR84620.1 hypothetical protein EN866_32965 [Mesorhizobium sp. M2D.F.Ca.ET.223.01.1.1]TGT64495.1 hypothetical protein EN802_32420 [bacterium M00.F.Ca.ET.159.01.1.1]TGT79340.1 hypothetical protein EN800_31760 [bacterium M00.F.Ca.ET.157.01.1.1]